MLLERIEKRIDFISLKEEIKKIGVNFITAGVVGVFINHMVGLTFSTMFWTCLLVTVSGIACLLLGVMRIRRNKL